MFHSAYGAVSDFVLNKPQGLSRCHLLGRAGTGKSYAIQKLAEAAESQGQKTHVCAFTHEIANALGGTTIHNTFGFRVWNGKTILGPEPVFSRGKPDLVFIDEYTLIDKALWSFVQQRASDLGIRLVLVGDPYQLPPVRGKPVIPMYSNDTHELTTQYRNPEMAELIEWFVWHIAHEQELDVQELLNLCTHGPIEQFIGEYGECLEGNHPIILGYNNRLFHELDASYPDLGKDNWCLCVPKGSYNIGELYPRNDTVFLEKDVIPDWSRTVHKAQGKTYQGSPIVMLNNILAAPMHLRKRLLYVACTRGTELPSLCTDPYIRPRRRPAYAEGS